MTRQSSQEVEHRLQTEVEALDTLIESHGLAAKKNTWDQVHKQLAGISALVDCWWQRVGSDLEPVALLARWNHWVDELLLPLMQWQQHLSHTRCPGQKAQIAQALQVIQDAFEQPPCTEQLGPEVVADRKAWAADHGKAFY